MVEHKIFRETLKNVKNEKYTLQVLDYGKKTDKHGKCDAKIVGRGIWQETLKNVENETETLQDLDYGEKTDRQGK